MQHPGLLALEQELKDCLRIAGQKTYRMGQEHPERDPERVWAWMLENALEDFAYQWPMLLYCRGITEQFSKPHAPCHIHLEINRRWEDPIRRGDYYRVESADTLWGIARRYGITLEELYAVNPGLKAEDPRKLAVGRELILPYGVPFRMRASLELLLPMHQQRMLEAYYHLGFLKKYSGIASLDLAYYREGRSPFGQDRMPLVTPGWSYQTVWKQEAHPSQRPWTLAGTKVGFPPVYRFDSEGKGIKIGEPAHSPRLHLAEQNRWATPPADGPVVAIDWLNLAPERMQDGWKETLAACRISLEAVYDAYEESLPYIKAVGRGIGSVLEGMAIIRPVKEGEPSTIPEALESIKDIPKNLVNLPSQLEEVYEKGTAEQQIETTIVVGESLVGMLRGKPPKVKGVVAAGVGSKKANKLGKVVNAADEAALLAKHPEWAEAWKKLDDLGADDAIKKNPDALEYLADGRSDKILLEVEELLGGHSKARHGSHLSMSEMEQRVLGTHPSMPQSRSALKFDSDVIHEDAVSKAFAHHKPTIESHFNSSSDYLELDFNYGSKVGEGFTNTGTRKNPVSSQVSSDIVKVAFKADPNSPGGYILDSAYPFYE